VADASALSPIVRAVRPFRFGVQIVSATSRRDWQEKARRAEALGFDVLHVSDHLADGFPPLAALCSAADATERLRVGTFVVNNDFRSPVVLAREAATIDLLTDGRLELGIGAGHMKHEYDEAGLRFDPAAVRVSRLEESVAVLKRLLAGEVTTFVGEHYTVQAHHSYPQPVQQPVPLLVGGNGHRVLALAARAADIVGLTGFSQVEGTRNVNLSHFTFEGTRRQVDWVRASAGSRFDDLELNALLQHVEITDDARAAFAPLCERTGYSLDDALTSPFLLAGSAPAMADALRQRREELGLSYFVVFERAMDDFARVIDQLR
jgi:probable F420-dependent oxidoreductase